MTSAVFVARMRAILNEATAGFFSDTTDLYPFADGSQNFAIQLGLTKERMSRASGVDYKSPLLIPLITLDTLNTTTVGAGFQEYSLPSAFLDIHYAEYRYSTNDVTQRYPCAIVDFSEAAKRGVNAYAVSGKSPLVYIRAEKIGFQPQPLAAVASYYQHYYYAQPTLVASGVEFALREEAHEAMMLIAVSFALGKDGKASDFFEKGLRILEGLV